MEKYVIIVAGGKGLRMGGDIPKQFIPVHGLPVLMRTIQAFYQSDPRTHIILVLPVSHQNYWHTLCHEYHFDVPYQLADGGETRFHSVRNGLCLVPDGVVSLVAVHDGVRPFVAPAVIDAAYQEASRTGAVVPVVDMVDSVRQVSGSDNQAVDRSRLKVIQTPQVFTSDILKAAYALEYDPKFTDDASVVEASGKKITLVCGNRENIKITTPFDLIIAEALTQQ